MPRTRRCRSRRPAAWGRRGRRSSDTRTLCGVDRRAADVQRIGLDRAAVGRRRAEQRIDRGLVAADAEAAEAGSVAVEVVAGVVAGLEVGVERAVTAVAARVVGDDRVDHAVPPVIVRRVADPAALTCAVPR